MEQRQYNCCYGYNYRRCGLWHIAGHFCYYLYIGYRMYCYNNCYSQFIAVGYYRANIGLCR